MGGVEHLKAILFLLNKAYSSGNNYDYYHIITGQDYLLVKPEDFDKTVGNDGYSYLEYFSCPNPNWKGWGGGYDILKYYTLASYCDVRKSIGRILNRFLYLVQTKLHFARSLPHYPIYGGSTYMSLTSEAVMESLYSEIAKDLLRRLNNTTCAEEIYFQTVLMNSSCKEHVHSTNLRYIDWNAAIAPKYLSEEDYDKLATSGCLFCRKIDSDLSADLLMKLRKKLAI